MIKHTELIRAALSGETVEGYDPQTARWNTFPTAREAVHAMVTSPERRFRIKQEPVVVWATITRDNGRPRNPVVNGRANLDAAVNAVAQGTASAILRLELDIDTLQVISSRTETP